MGRARKAIKRVLQVVIPDQYIVWRRQGIDKSLYLTFDDGPNPEFTPQVLDLLDSLGAKASFFLVGDRATQHRDLVREIVERGHTVGNHSYSHRTLPELRSSDYADEIDQCKSVLSDLCGREITMFRPPKGLVSPGALLYLLRGGHQVVLWSLDSLDYLRTSHDTVVRTVDAAKVRGGDIILMHDDNKFTISALRDIANTAHDRGLALEGL